MINVVTSAVVIEVDLWICIGCFRSAPIQESMTEYKTLRGKDREQESSVLSNICAVSSERTGLHRLDHTCFYSFIHFLYFHQPALFRLSALDWSMQTSTQMPNLEGFSPSYEHIVHFALQSWRSSHLPSLPSSLVYWTPKINLFLIMPIN